MLTVFLSCELFPFPSAMPFSFFSTHTYFHFLLCLPQFHRAPPVLTVWLLCLGPSIMVWSCSLSHLLSFLSLTGLTVRPKLDWTVTHRVTDENKPPALGLLLKSQHHSHGAPTAPAQPCVSSHKQHTNGNIHTLSGWLNNTGVLAAPFTPPGLSVIDWLCHIGRAQSSACRLMIWNSSSSSSCQ